MKRFINTIVFLVTATLMMAQNSFIVADRNGNSRLVQNLIFQSETANDQFSWSGDNDVTGDIKDLLFIARTNKSLSTATPQEVNEIISALAGTGKVDAEAVAEVLRENNEVEAYSLDGAHIAVRSKNGGGFVVYPMYDLTPLFSDNTLQSVLSLLKNAPKQNVASSATNGKIAIFNYFDGLGSTYSTQNAIVNAIKNMFVDHGYEVEYYGDGSNGLNFYQGALNQVVAESEDYKAIIIMSHGTCRWTDVNDYNNQYPEVAKKKRHLIATKEYAYVPEVYPQDLGEYIFKEPSNGDCFYMMDCELKVKGDCILYDGSCYSAPTSGFSTDSEEYPNVSQSVVLGWNGANRMSQAHAALLFYRMLYERYNLKDAYDLTFKQDPTYGSFYLVKESYDPVEQRYDRDHSRIFASKYVGNQRLPGNSNLQKQFHPNASVRLASTGDMTVLATGNDRMKVHGEIYGDLGVYPFIKVILSPIYGAGSYEISTTPTKLSDVNHYTFLQYIPLKSEGIYDVIIKAFNYSTGQYETLMPNTPLSVIYSGSFHENCALPVVSDENTRTPVVLNGEYIVSSISVPAGAIQTFRIDGYYVHSFNAVSLHSNIVSVSVSGTTLTVTGVAEGETYIGVYDEQNRQMSAIKVTVSSASSNNLCPDDNHPHMIDLGLPSGTKWACCNVGASKPEDYGDYFAWGETEGYNSGKTNFDWSTYKWCNGSDSTMTKYYLDSNYGYRVFKDNKTELDPEDDAAYVNWGRMWRIPCETQYRELISSLYTTAEWTTQNEVYGRKITSKSNGNTIFLPAAGERFRTSYASGSQGNYWSRTLRTSNPEFAQVMGYHDSNLYVDYIIRSFGCSVRPVALFLLSTNIVSLKKGQTCTVPITFGSGSYDAVSNATSITTVTIDKSKLIIKAVNPGSATITVKDNQFGESAKIEVTVTDISQDYLCPDENHPHMIDLGLPSGTKWACCNVGASKPEDYGDYFAWGETEGYNSGKSHFDWGTYKWCNGTYKTMTKYCFQSEYGSDGFTDDKTELDLEDDAAYVNWGIEYRIPNYEQYDELLLGGYTTFKWTTMNGVKGRLITSKTNGNSIFLPASGSRRDTSLYTAGSYGAYWSRTFSSYQSDRTYSSHRSDYAWFLGFASSDWDVSDYRYHGYYRYDGNSVRPVRNQ